ncbi:MAG: antibiotic biosynthesis monooxygenase [Acidobacteria bacterium]|nr:MAG: antibiotic biosynthesis monooxygenase [Acidobacteriota bacterium]
MAEVIVVARIKAKPEAAGKVRAELLKLIPPTRQGDEGCIYYDLHQDQSDPTLFYFLEKWESNELLDKHLETEHLRAFGDATDGLVSELDINRLTKIA